MTVDELGRLLAHHGEVSFVEDQLLGRRPWIFTSDDLYKEWLTTVAKELAFAEREYKDRGERGNRFQP